MTSSLSQLVTLSSQLVTFRSARHHELCHFALYLTFNNFACPYKEKDEESERAFDLVIEDCKMRKDEEDIVAWALDNYSEEMIPPEVAVRYAHMLGHYYDQPDVIHQRSETFASLKEFHEERAMPAMDETIQNLERKADIKGKYLNVKKKNFIMINVIWILMALLVIGAPIIYYFAKGPTRVWNDLNDSERKIIKNSSVEYFGVGVRFGDLFDEEHSSAFQDLAPNQISEVLENDPNGIEKNFNNTLFLKVTLTWHNCTEALKWTILNSTVNFQGSRVKLGNILDYDSDILYDFTSEEIKNLIQGKDLKIGTKFDSGIEFNIERKLKSSEKTLSVREAIVEAFEEGYFFLIDGPGAGKSTVMNTLPNIIKELHPGFFVLFINCIEISDGDNLNIRKLGEKILRLEGIELKILIELYLKGKVAMIFDAFDEVKSEAQNSLHQFFSQTLLHLTRDKEKNIILISSRSAKMFNNYQNISLKNFNLIPFDEKDRDTFFSKRLEDLRLEDQKKIKLKIQKFIETTENNLWDTQTRSVNNPLMLRIIADVLKSKEITDINNHFSLYEKFVEKQIESIKDLKRLQLLAKQRLSFYEIHQIYALKTLVSESFSNISSLDISPITLTLTEISSFGLMTAASDGQLNFIHKNFADFFVVHYLADKLYNMTETASEMEIELRIQMLHKIFDQNWYPVLHNFMEDYLNGFYEIKDWNERNLESGRKILLQDVSENKFLYTDKEIFRRLLLKDFKTFSKVVDDRYGNIFHFLKTLKIELNDTNILLNSNSSETILKPYKINNQLGNIFFQIWFYIQKKDFSKAYVINRYTGLNLSELHLKKLKEQKSFSSFYISIEQSLSVKEKFKMFNINFKFIFFKINDDEEFLKRWTIITKDFKSDQVMNIFQQKVEYGNNILHIIFDLKILKLSNLEIILNELGKTFNKETLKKIIQSENHSGESSISKACNADFAILKVYWKFVRTYLTESEIKYHLLCQIPIKIGFNYDTIGCKHKDFFYDLISEDNFHNLKNLFCITPVTKGDEDGYEFLLDERFLDKK